MNDSLVGAFRNELAALDEGEALPDGWVTLGTECVCGLFIVS